MNINRKLFAVCLSLVLLMTAAASAFSDNGSLPENNFFVANTAVSDNEVYSNRHTQADSASEEPVNRLDLEGFELKMENERFQVWFSEETCGIRIKDKDNGYIWGALEEKEPEDMNETWSAMANSLCTIEYFNELYAEKRISISDETVTKNAVWDGNRLEFTADFTEQGISFTFVLELLSDGISAGIKEGTLRESGGCRIKSLYIMPFLGCSRENLIDGYMFVPDGPGALIRYEKPGNYVSGFEGKVYGLDMGIDSLTVASDLQASRTNDYLVDTPQVTFPVFGIVHGIRQNAVMGIIEGGEEYASILAMVAGTQTNYYWTTARFDYRQLYVHATGSDGQGVYQAQDAPEDFDPWIKYVFLSGENADYSGMAVSYREYLMNLDMLGKERIDTEMPMRLDIVGAEIKEGILFNTTEKFTTVSQATEFFRFLEEKGIGNLTMVYEGWQNGGISGSRYGTSAFERKIGSKSDFEKLKELVTGKGGRFYLQCNPVTANKDQINPKKKAAVTKSNSLAKFIRPNTSVMYYESYLIKPSSVIDTLNKYFSELDGFSLSLLQLGSRLYADYTRSSEVTRKENEEMIVKAAEGREGLAFSQVNQYLWKYTDEYFDIPTVSSQYLFETDTVPFLQMVLKGSVDYYASYANQGFYSQTSILKMIEYGCYPSFMVTYSDNYSLTDTPLADYFSLNFYDWSETMTDIYEQVSSVLEKTEGKYIESHRMIASGVARISYTGGTVVYVNYNNRQYVADGITVPAQGTAVKG